MVNADPDARHRAPARLELVRCFLNTWDFDVARQEPDDLLAPLIRDRARFKRIFGVSPPRTHTEQEQLVALRDELRATLSAAPDEDAVLNRWLSKVPLRASVVDGRVVHEPTRANLAGLVLAAVVDAIARNEWSRLRACDDCRYIFYDHTRNQSRRWCKMGGEGPAGRSCGSIAKVRRYRARQRAQATKTKRRRRHRHT